MSVDAIINNQNQATSRNGAGMGNSAADLTQSFMTLLVAQMQNQDPTNPMDNNQLTSQLAQFNTAAGVEKLNGTVESVGGLMYTMQQMSMASWVGRDVLIKGDSTLSHAEDGNKEFAFNLDGDADKVTVTLTGDDGSVWTAELNNVDAGVNTFNWDDLSGFQPAEPPTGSEANYKVNLSASNAEGDAPEVIALKKAQVEGVSFETGMARLRLGADGIIGLDEIFLIQ